ncbi:MAG: glucose-1-phosphate thymidylyltransferase [Sphingobacteriales bacterium]|jgi:glucose-1-phosphate thymidylyltransferase
MKAIIPLAGIGSRLRPQTHTQPKALVPVAGKPLLAHIIDSLIPHDIEEYIFVIGYLGDKVENYITENYQDIKKTFVVQLPKMGTGHAIWSAKGLIKAGDEILIVLGDTIFNVDYEPIINSKYSILGVKKVEDPRSFGVAEITDDFITKVVEKPTMPKSNLALVGLYKVKEGLQLMQALEENINNKIKTDNEFQLTDGLMVLIKQGVKFKPFTVENWYDCGKKSALLETNKTLLKKDGYATTDYSRFNNTIIIPPVSISESSMISDCIIGPNVSIGENTKIERSIIRNSIIGAYDNLDSIVLKDSLIGNDASIKGYSQSLNLGDNTDIQYN